MDRPLKLESKNIAWGKEEGKKSYPDNFPTQIEPGKSGIFYVYSPAARSYGIEFYLNFHDVAPEDKFIYGTVRISVDMPYWKHQNTSSCTVTGLLQKTGFQKVPDGAHDFSTSVTISKSLI